MSKHNTKPVHKHSIYRYEIKFTNLRYNKIACRKRQLSSKSSYDEKLSLSLSSRSGSMTSSIPSSIATNSMSTLSMTSAQGHSHPSLGSSNKRLETILDKYCRITLPFYLQILSCHCDNIEKVK